MNDEVMPEQRVKGETRRFFLFEIDGELYAVAVEEVERVMKIPPITPVPNAPRAIIGIFHLRGQVVVVLDLISRMNMHKNHPLIANFLCVILHKKNRFGILVDHPKSIVEVEMQSMKVPDPLIAAHVPPKYIEGVFMFEDVFTSRKKDKPIIIGPAGIEPSARIAPMVVKRPVLWLNIDKLLDQADLATVFASQA